MERSVDLIVKLVQLASLPLMGRVRHAALRLVSRVAGLAYGVSRVKVLRKNEAPGTAP